MAAIIPMPPPSHETVVRHFVRSYYKLLNQAPDLVSRFYANFSEIVRPEPDGSISCTNTVRLIRMKIMSQHNKGMKAEVLSSHYTKLDDENFKIYVTGHFKGEDVRGFAQSFHLVFINKRYSVLHDILHYLNIPARVDGVSAGHTPLVHESADLEQMMKQITFESEIVPGDSQIMATIIPHSHEIVVRDFLKSYYKLLNDLPGLVYRFYLDDSQIFRPEPDGSMSCTKTELGIRMKINSHHNEKMKAEILSSDYEEFDDVTLQIFVTGYFTGEDAVRGFVQIFRLASKDGKYFVLHDRLRYLDIPARVGVHTPLVQESRFGTQSS